MTRPALSTLIERRERACRLRPEFALRDLNEAADFLRDRGMLTLAPDCSLPSLFGACHEEPYAPGSSGFGLWPKTRWWWGSALASRPGVHLLRIHRGKGLYLPAVAAGLVDPLCRAALDAARQGSLGPDAATLIAYLDRAGPSLVDDVLVESRIGPRALKKARTALERMGAVVARERRVAGAGGGHRHVSELATWQHVHAKAATGGGLEALLVAGVEAAVVAPEPEVVRWFSWPIGRGLIDALVAGGRLWRPQPDWLAVT